MRRLFNSHTSREALGAIFWNFTGMSFSLITGILTARLLAPDDRGLLALALTISSLGYLISSMGTNHSVRTFQPKVPWASFRIYLKLSSILLLWNIIVVAGVVAVFIMVGFTAFSDNLVIISLLGAFTFSSNQMLDMFNAAGHVSRSALTNTIGHFSTMLFLMAIFLFVEPLHSLPGALCAYILGFIIRILAMIKFARVDEIDFGQPTTAMGGTLLRSGLKFWGIGLGQTLTFRSDQLILGYLSTAYNVGLYAVAVAPASLMQVVTNSIGQVAYRQAALAELTMKKYTKLMILSFSVTLLYGVLLWFSAPWLVPFVFGADYTDSVPIVRTLLVAQLLLCPYLISVRVLSGYNRPYISSVSGILGFFTLVPALFMLVPKYGALGAALGSILAYGVMLIIVTVGVMGHFRLSNKS